MEKYFYLVEWAYNISIGTAIVPVIAAIFRGKYFNFPLKIAAINAVRIFIISWMALYFSFMNHNNQFFFYIGPCLDIILVSLLTISIFNLKKELKWALALLCVTFIALTINDYLSSKTLLNSYLLATETIFVIIVSILMLRKVVLTYKSSTYKRSLILVLSALLIINLSAILIPTLMEKISAFSTDLMQHLWYLFYTLFIIITNLMVAYGFYIIRNKVREA
jgi:hypothetical protein